MHKYEQANLLYVLTILEAIEKTHKYTEHFQTPEELLWANDQLNFNAAYTTLLVIGEESSKIASELKSFYPDIPWDNIRRFRNHLAHRYQSADPQIIFDVIRNELPPLKSALVDMLQHIDYSILVLKTALESPAYQNIHYLKTLVFNN